MPDLGNENFGVQQPLVHYAAEVGWAKLTRDEALTLRKGESGNLLYAVLRDKLINLNPGVVTVDNVDRVIEQIESVRYDISGNWEILKWLRGEQSIYVESEKRRLNIAVIDFEHPSNNVFHVSDEWQYTNGKYRNRADVVFLINGIPVAVVETKGASKPEGISEGITQLRRYHNETPELMTAPQLFDVTHLIDFYYGVTWNLERKGLFNWKDEEKGNFERKVKRFFARERFLRFIESWIVFYKKDDELKKIVLRQHQTRAVDKVVERCLDPEKTRGLVWHTQGSGKTFTMIQAAEEILHRSSFLESGAGRPTVIMLVDRTELEGQLFGNLTAYGLEPEVATSKAKLKELLRADYRGLIVSMIHKFDRADANLSARDNIFLLIDEAHRSTGGDLGNYLVAALPNATLIGFTGTPVDRTAHGQGTFKTFGKDDAPKGYLDKYSIKESITDGTTLPLKYALAPNELLVPKDTLEREFLALAETQGISDIEELNKILDRAVTLKAFLKSDDRVAKVSKFVAQHFKENVEPLGYKAFLVAVDRPACVLYKKALDALLPPEYSAVVYSVQHNDSEDLKRFTLADDEEKRIRKAFTKKDQNPKILIVTEKLLTGFDAPILYCMYLDKPMRDHALLQAIARVNRPYEEDGDVKKPSGFVLDFVGIFQRLKDALSFDSDEVESVVENIDVLKARFKELMDGPQGKEYIKLAGGHINDKAVERAIAAFADKERREAFYTFFREVEALYEIVSPDAFLRPYIDPYGKLAALYKVVLNAFTPKALLIKELMNKTEELVRKHVLTAGLNAVLPAVRIDEKTLDALKDKDEGNPANVINLGRSLLSEVQEQAAQQPYLVPIGERAEGVLAAYGERQIGTQEAMNRLKGLMDDYLKTKKQLAASGLDPITMAIQVQLNEAGVKEAEKVAPELKAVLGKFPNHQDNAEELRSAKAALYKVLMPVAGKEKMVKLAEQILRLGHK